MPNVVEVEITAKNKQAIAAFKGTAQELDNMSRAASKSVVGANQASNALTNLGRVAQDAPFGFIGIQNNINPLLESFQRLKAETGSISGALKALSQSMLGPAGIGVAVSLATSALTYLTMSGLFKTVDATKEAKKEMDEFNKSLKGAESSALATGAKLSSFVEIAKNATLPLKQRNEALKEANKLMGEHGTKLTLANVASAETTRQVNQLTQALVAQALAARMADRVADLLIKQSEASKEYGKVKTSFENIKKSADALNGTIEGNVVRGQILTDRYKELVGVSTKYKTVTQELKDITGLFNQQLLKSTELFSLLGTKEKEVVAKKEIHKVKAKELTELYREYNAQLVLVNAQYDATIMKENTLVKLRPMLLDGINSINAATDKQLALQQTQAEFIASGLTPSFDAFFQTLFSGGDAVQAFIDSLKQMLSKIIATLVAALALQAVLSALFPGKAASGAFSFSKILGMVGGGGLSSFFNNKNATGGVATKATAGIFGEAGPEAIIPLNRLPEMIGSISDGGGVQQFTIRGSDLVTVLNRSNQNLNFIG